MWWTTQTSLQCNSLKSSMERNWNPQRRDGFDLGDNDEENKLEELEVEFKPLTKLMKEVVGDKVEKVIVSDRIVDLPCVLTTSWYVWSVQCGAHRTAAKQ